MDSNVLLVGILLLLVVLTIASLKVGAADAGTRMGAWLVLTLVTLWCEATAAFVLLHALLFTLGTTAVWVGVLVTVAVMVATPFLVGTAIRRSTHRSVTHR